jgi:hypothetical protein
MQHFYKFKKRMNKDGMCRLFVCVCACVRARALCVCVFVRACVCNCEWSLIIFVEIWGGDKDRKENLMVHMTKKFLNRAIKCVVSFELVDDHRTKTCMLDSCILTAFKIQICRFTEMETLWYTCCVRKATLMSTCWLSCSAWGTWTAARALMWISTTTEKVGTS